MTASLGIFFASASAQAQSPGRAGRACEPEERAAARRALEVGRAYAVECRYLDRHLRVDAAIVAQAPEEGRPIELRWATSRVTSRSERVLAKGRLDLRSLAPTPALLPPAETFAIHFRSARGGELQLSIRVRSGERDHRSWELIWLARVDRRSGRWSSLWLGLGDTDLLRMDECEIDQEVRLRVRGGRVYRRWHQRRHFNPDRTRTEPPVAQRDRECAQPPRPPSAEPLAPRALP